MSSLTGAGIQDVFQAFAEKKGEYEKEYKPELDKRIQERTEEMKTEGLDRLMKDLKVGSSGNPANSTCSR